MKTVPFTISIGRTNGVTLYSVNTSAQRPEEIAKVVRWFADEIERNAIIQEAIAREFEGERR